MSEGVWGLLERNFASLEQLNEFFNVWRQSSKEPEDEFEVEQVRLQAIERFKERAAAASAAAERPLPQPKPPLEPLPPDATDDQKAERLYGPSLQATKRPPLRVGESRASVAHEADDQAALELYGSSVVGIGSGPVRPKDSAAATDSKKPER